nr:MAG: RNA-dependent RNA polymerase [Wufeng shrew permutotetravirus 3]
MDASNPVMNGDRRTGLEMRRLASERVRQNLPMLSQVAQSASREILPTEDLLPLEQVTGTIKLWTQMRTVLADSLPTRPVEKLVFDLPKVDGEIPVSGLLTAEGVPLHPPGVNQVKGVVTTTRSFGGLTKVVDYLPKLAQALGDVHLEPGPKYVYTRGRVEGFQKRIKEQMSRPTRSVLKYKQGKPFTRQAIVTKLKSLFPVDTGKFKLQAWDEDLYGLVDQIQITFSSSAGPPYWRSKVDAYYETLYTVLPLIVRSIKEGSLEQLRCEQPELFLVEVKNKCDRYEVSKLNDKVRPYVCIPAHWQYLFGVMSQTFTEGLELFCDNPVSANAYGFSSANGGLMRFARWAWACEPKQLKFACYGDDTYMVYRKPDGTLWRCDPDFKQMDGSVDRDCMVAVVDFCYKTLAQKYGDNSFWRAVADVWLEMASCPHFLIDGPQVYKKATANGLMTGVTGTTFFDTAKSVLSWDYLRDAVETGSVNLFDEKQVTDFMLKQCGLVIKEGTWGWEQIPQNLSVVQPGDTLGSHKFLGIMVQFSLLKEELVAHPYLPVDDLVDILLCPRDDPLRPEKSALARQRLAFDRMRGIYLTAGFSQPFIENAIHNVVNEIPVLPIVMATQMEGGMKPETPLFGPDGFQYPDSIGFPSREFCLSLYSEGGPDHSCWKPLIPGMKEYSDILRASGKPRSLLIGKGEKSTEPAQVRVVLEEPVVPPAPSVFDVLDVPKKVKIKVGSPDTPYNKRSRITQILSDTGALGKSESFLPRSSEALSRAVQETLLVSEAVVKTGLNRKQIQKELVNTDLFVVQQDPARADLAGDDILVKKPPLPYGVISKQVADDRRVKRDLVDRSTSLRFKGVLAERHAPKVKLETSIFITEDYKRQFTMFVPWGKSEGDYKFTYLNKLANWNGAPFTFKTVASHQAQGKQEITVEMRYALTSETDDENKLHFRHIAGVAVAPSKKAASYELVVAVLQQLNSEVFDGKLDPLFSKKDFYPLTFEKAWVQADQQSEWYAADKIVRRATERAVGDKTRAEQIYRDLEKKDVATPSWAFFNSRVEEEDTPNTSVEAQPRVVMPSGKLLPRVPHNFSGNAEYAKAIPLSRHEQALIARLEFMEPFVTLPYRLWHGTGKSPKSLSQQRVEWLTKRLKQYEKVQNPNNFKKTFKSKQDDDLTSPPIIQKATSSGGSTTSASDGEPGVRNERFKSKFNTGYSPDERGYPTYAYPADNLVSKETKSRGSSRTNGQYRGKRSGRGPRGSRGWSNNAFRSYGEQKRSKEGPVKGSPRKF